MSCLNDLYRNFVYNKMLKYKQNFDFTVLIKETI